ncbi:MAG: dienelactone hydrolase family protein [Pseudomonadales bacterium]|nr:dienelactone hydrolase family protein [Pseudomonadales bacterium]
MTTGDHESVPGAIETILKVTCEGRDVPAVLWEPESADGPVPLVLVGHGGGGHKRAPTVTRMAAGLAREHGIATLAIDGPVNGDRVENNDEAWALRKQDRHAYRRRYYMEKYSQMVADWQAALDVAVQRPLIDGSAVGYWGLSMGTRFGVPLVVAEPRIKAAVLGLFGYGEGVETNQRVYDDIVRVSVPVLFIQQLQDDEVSQRAYYDLFQMIGTENKRLHANPGRHAAVPRSETEASRLFLARKLKGAQDD